uniref:RNase H type-1 domain-containing protein n=1 Tax=Angiostrongylus cantonensis TaxID=6313 RepID=A0A0K0DBH2_ANGCA
MANDEDDDDEGDDESNPDQKTRLLKVDNSGVIVNGIVNYTISHSCDSDVAVEVTFLLLQVLLRTLDIYVLNADSIHFFKSHSKCLSQEDTEPEFLATNYRRR